MHGVEGILDSGTRSEVGPSWKRYFGDVAFYFLLLTKFLQRFRHLCPYHRRWELVVIRHDPQANGLLASASFTGAVPQG